MIELWSMDIFSRHTWLGYGMVTAYYAIRKRRPCSLHLHLHVPPEPPVLACLHNYYFVYH